MSIIELENIYFRYAEDEPWVLKNFSLKLEAGSCTVITGDNGSGKSTLFRILNGLSFPERGTYRFDGSEITEKALNDNSASKLFHKRIGFLFQNPDVMLFNARVYDEVAFGPRQMGLSDVEVQTRTDDCLKLFDIGLLSDKAPYHLSGGQKKKVAFAAVMALNPEVLVLDEPFEGLDAKSREWLLPFLKDLKTAGKTLIMATHNSSLVAEITDCTVDMNSYI